VAEIPFGGEDITRDLSVVLNMSPKNAEQLKREYGCVCCDSEEGEQSISFQTTAGRTRTQTRHQLSQIIEARQQEILEFVRQEIERTEVGQKLAAGMIFTGGGALLQNLPQLGEQVLGMPVRLGLPQDVLASESLQDPHYATAIGLLRFASEDHQEEAHISPVAPSTERFRDRVFRLFSLF
jgi:cell division protein FtsA